MKMQAFNAVRAWQVRTAPVESLQVGMQFYLVYLYFGPCLSGVMQKLRQNIHSTYSTLDAVSHIASRAI